MMRVLTKEFVEIACHTDIDLTGYKIILYNGKHGASYKTAHLLNICFPNENFVAELYASSSGIQNGNTDGIALIDPNDQVLEFISFHRMSVLWNRVPQKKAHHFNWRVLAVLVEISREE